MCAPPGRMAPPGSEYPGSTRLLLVFPWSNTAWFASCTSLGSSDTCMMPLGILRKPASTASTARRDATSPRSWPPTPSASANSQPCDSTCAGDAGATWPRKSSLCWRVRPESVSSANSSSSIGGGPPSHMANTWFSDAPSLPRRPADMSPRHFSAVGTLSLPHCDTGSRSS